MKKINCKNLIFVDDKYPTNAYLIAAEFSIGSNCHTSLESFFLTNQQLIGELVKKIVI